MLLSRGERPAWGFAEERYQGDTFFLNFVAVVLQDSEIEAAEEAPFAAVEGDELWALGAEIGNLYFVTDCIAQAKIRTVYSIIDFCAWLD